MNNWWEKTIKKKKEKTYTLSSFKSCFASWMGIVPLNELNPKFLLKNESGMK